jgi:hypothetical protein
MSVSYPLLERESDMTLPLNVDYNEPFIGTAAAYLQPNLVAFPSNVDCYQDISVSMEPIGHSSGQSLEHPSNATVIDKPPANVSGGALPQGDVCPDGQVHHVEEKDAK